MDLKSLQPKKPLLPDEVGYFGSYGGRYVPEVLVPNLEELAAVFDTLRATPDFWQEYVTELIEFSGRPTPITPCKNLSRELGGAQIYLKREDLNQTGAHKINNVIGQGLIAKRLGKKRVIAETGAGQHGVATATMAARFGLDAVVYMGAEDVERQRPNVFWMEQMGATVVPVTAGTRTLKDAINEAMRDWATHVEDTHYVLGTACGPDPFPALVAWLQSIIGAESKKQMASLFGSQPDVVVACVGGGSNATGIFQEFFHDSNVRLIGVEAGGKGDNPGEHASRIAVLPGTDGNSEASGTPGTPGIAQGYHTVFLQSDSGQMHDTHSVSAGLDYVGISPILADWAKQGRLEMARASDQEVVHAVRTLMRSEGIVPALESAHGIAHALALAPQLSPSQSILVSLSGRGDKDIFTVADALGDESWSEFLAQKGRI